MKTRSIKELLELVLESYKQNTHYKGLCNIVVILAYVKKTNEDETTMLHSYIKNNKPTMFSLWNMSQLWLSPYYWFPGDTKSRIKWLNKHIKKNS